MQLLSRTCNYGTMNVQRIVARAFVVLGGLVWIVGALFAPYGNRTVSPMISARNSLLMLALTAGVFAVAYFYERLAALLLLLGAAGVVVYGLATGWEMGEWWYLGIVLILPLLVSGLLFALAARMENVCRLSEEGGGTVGSGGSQVSA